MEMRKQQMTADVHVHYCESVMMEQQKKKNIECYNKNDFDVYIFFAFFIFLSACFVLVMIILFCV